MSDNYCKCKGCKHIDPNERSGYKWYCTWYHTYEDPDYVRECSRFENQDGGGCFLTSACCQFKGLPDDCAELTALRAFRDSYLKSSAEGQNLIDEYYRIAPALVEKLDCHNAREALYDNIYLTICSIISTIEDGEYECAVAQYKEMVLWVQDAVNKKTNCEVK